MKTRLLIIGSILGILHQNLAQTPVSDTVSDAFLDSLAAYFDHATPNTHFLSARIGYTNKALFAGRDFGLNQSMLVPSITYIHKSGLYAELSGYSYSQSQPRYQFTAASVGYMGLLGRKFNYSVEYGRTFSASASIPNVLANSLSAYGTFTHKKLVASLNYSFFFDQYSASHLLVPSIGLSFATKKIGFINQISFAPSLNATFGSSSSFLNTFNPGASSATGNTSTGRPNWGGGPPPWVLADTTGTLQRPDWVTSGSSRPGASLSGANAKFGLMAVTLSAPVRFKVKSLTVSVTPGLTKPIALSPYEQLSRKPQFNFSIGVSYSLGWK